ncbi:hypothetical protein [Bremerella sp.]|uniref:hypothetical protein n=1 Tax=Bremerella sp. TaxID=2795602 RepID=UPI00391D2C07
MRVCQLGFAAIILLLISSVVFAQDAVQKEFQERFFVPEQGHIELRYSHAGHLEGREIKTEADLLKLLDEIEKIPYSEEGITSWKFFEQVGFKRVLPPLPEPPPGSTGKVQRVPDWRKIEITFTKDHFLQREDILGHESIAAWSPISEVSIRQHPQHYQVNHYRPGTNRSRFVLGAGTVFQRESGGFEQKFTPSQMGDREAWTFSTERAQRVILSRPGKDIIDAVYIGNGDRVFNVSLHLYHQPPAGESGMWTPRLIVQLRSQSKSQTRFSAYLVQNVDFTTPVPKEAFEITATKGSTYVYEDSTKKVATRLAADIKDILNLTPMLACEFIETDRREYFDRLRKQEEAQNAAEQKAKAEEE